MISSRKIYAAVLTLAAVLVFAGCEKGPELPDLSKSPGDGFVAMFNGKNFTGWDFGGYKQEDTSWSVQDGIMHCAGEPRTPYLVTTDKPYENYEFYGEFRISKGCNSGIFHHVPLAGRQSKLGFETQIMDDGHLPPDKNSSGSIYDVVPPTSSEMGKPGEWNQYHVIFNWPRCQVWLNGVQVQDTDLSANPELRYRVRKGPMAVSNHGHEVDYKNLWIKELPASDKGGDIFNGRDLSGWENIGDTDWHVEDGMLVSSKGEGWLVTEKSYNGVYFHAYVDSDTLTTREARFYYRFKSPEKPGYSADLFDHLSAKNYIKQYGDKIPGGLIRPSTAGWFFYRIASNDRESKVWLNEFLVSDNKLLGLPPEGKIAIYRGANDGVIRIKGIKLREIEGPGI